MLTTHILYAIHEDACGTFWKEVAAVVEGEDLATAQAAVKAKYGSCLTYERD